jgi:hypothetical protein
MFMYEFDAIGPTYYEQITLVHLQCTHRAEHSFEYGMAGGIRLSLCVILTCLWYILEIDETAWHLFKCFGIRPNDLLDASTNLRYKLMHFVLYVLQP